MVHLLMRWVLMRCYSMLAVMLSVLFVGCGADRAGRSQTASNADTPHETAAQKVLRRELAAARTRWAAADISDYRYTTRTSCFCAPESATVVVVRNGRAHAILGTGTADTIEDLYAAITAAIGTHDRVTARYDRRGIPVLVAFDPDRRMVDEEHTVFVSGFRELGRGG